MKRFLLAILLFAPFVNVRAQVPLKKVVATASIFADMADKIGGGHVEVKTIVPIGGDPHIYEPTPADVRLLASADLILMNGLTFEGWINGLATSSGATAKVVTITNGVQALQAAYKNSTDPHAWMDASNGLVYIQNIKNALVELDPANREVYEFNYGVYKKQLEDLDAYIFKEIASIPEQQRILITSHDAFQYFGRRYGLRLEAVLGISTEAEAQTADIVRLNKIIRENKVPAVFVETTVNPKLLEQIAKDNGVRIGGKLYSDSIGEQNGQAATYIDMLKYNTDIIVKALSQTTDSENTATDTPSTPGKWGLWVVLGLVLIAGFVVLWKKLG